MHPHTIPYLYRLRKSQWLSPTELERLQWQKLHRVVHHAYERVPYYRRLFDSEGIKPDDIRSLTDLSLIPITTKEALQQAPQEDLFAKRMKPAHCIERRTSGTTGRPVTVFLTNREKEAQDMVQARAMLENGLKLTDKRAVFVAPWQIPQRKYWFQRFGIWRKAYFSVFDDVRLQIPALERLAPDSLAGTPAILKLIALEKARGRGNRIMPRTIFSTADMLDKATRDLIESVFHVKVVDLYGSVEFGYMAWECHEHLGYHVNMESIVMELLKDGRSVVSNGEVGEVVCTSLLAYAMPLIRYRMGDLGVPSNEVCPCGRGLPLMKLFAGRANDSFQLPGGRVVTPQALADAMVQFAGMIQQFRIIQEREEQVSIHLVKGRDFKADTLPLIEEELTRVLGRDVHVKTQVSVTIGRDDSGKQRAIISNVPDRLG